MNTFPRVIGVLREVELSVAALYEAYRDRFPELKAFWQDLVNEENNHASLLGGLPKQMGEDKVFYNEKRFDLDFVQRTLDFIKTQLRLARTSKISVKEALVVALHIEESLTEKAFFAVFSGDQAALKTVLSRLDSETKMHRAKIKELLEKY